MKKVTLYEYVADIRVAVVIAAPSEEIAAKQIENWGVDGWLAGGDKIGVNDVELVDAREVERVDVDDVAHIDATKEDALCREK